MTRDTRTLIGTVALSALAAVISVHRSAARVGAQTQGRPSFEVASVKQNKSGDGFIRFAPAPGGRFTATNVPLRELIRFAYQVQPFQIEGGPSWMTSDRFDIVAKAEGNFPPGQPGGPPGPLQQMMQSLLAERFKLVTHNETKQMPIYALVLARGDGKLGAQLRKSEVDCATLLAGRRGGGPPAPPQPGERPVCGIRMGPGNIAGGGFPLSQLANSLSPFVQRIVIDRTGLTGNYDIELTYTPDQLPQGGPLGVPPPGAPPLPPIDPNGPSIFTALQEQLGLKLDSQRGPVEMFVIDSVEHPSED
jgi:bla regulator protein blaR1